MTQYLSVNSVLFLEINHNRSANPTHLKPLKSDLKSRNQEIRADFKISRTNWKLADPSE